MADKIYDVVIIGSGPSALTAAIYTARGNASTLVVGGENWGGQLMLTTLVENYPGFSEGIQGPDLMLEMKEQAEKFGSVFVSRNVTSTFFEKTPFLVTDSTGEKHLGKTVIIATGALTRWLGVTGEKELIGHGVSSCAPCDAPFYKNKVVAVIGGGDSAMEEANVLTKFAKKIYIIHRRDGFRASKIMQDKILNNEKIEAIWNTEVKEVKGKGRVSGLTLFNNKENKDSELTVDGVFVAIGHKPDSDVFKGPIEMDDRGYIKASNNTRTNIPGIFVAGDVHDDRYKQAVTAAGYGCMAGMDVLQYLEENTSNES